MATTYELISSYTVTGSSTSITFSSIPQTYKDIIIKYNLMVDFSDGYRSYAYYTTNNSGNYNRAMIFAVDSGTGVSSSPNTNAAIPYLCGFTTAIDGNANYYGCGELTIIDYASSSYAKGAIWDAGVMSSQPTTTRAIGFGGNQIYSTGAITSITLRPGGAGAMQIGSRASIYGLKSS